MNDVLDSTRPNNWDVRSPGLAYWRAGVRGLTKIEPGALNRMVSHPNFAAACLMSMREQIAYRHHTPALTRLMTDIQRTILAFFVLYLDARGGITLAAIRELVREVGLASPGRATAMLMSLRMLGYITPDPVQTDRRSRRYIPAPVTITAFRENFKATGRAFALFEPEALPMVDRFDEREFMNAYICDLGSGLASVLKRGEINPASLFADSNAGHGILFFLITRAMRKDDAFPPRRPLPLSINQLASEFKVSRAHVRNMLREGERRGLVSRNADESTVTLEEPLRQAIIEFQAVSFMSFANSTLGALEALSEA
jgi:DNA-binding MarR family transcriptional regulator